MGPGQDKGTEREAVRITEEGAPRLQPCQLAPHRPRVGLSSLPHQPHSWLCRHSWQVRKPLQLRHRGSECTLWRDRYVHGASEPGPLSCLTPLSHEYCPQACTCHPSHGSHHAGTGPGRRRRGSRCGWTGTRHTGWSWPGSPRRSDAWAWEQRPCHSSLTPCPRTTRCLGPVRLTGCRAGDTPPGSSGHPAPGPAGCMLHPLCG